MPVEMIGWIAPRVSSELIPPSGPPFEAEVIAETARIHERAGFDRVLIGYFSDAPDGFLVGAHAASMTERLIGQGSWRRRSPPASQRLLTSSAMAVWRYT
jgi:alkanesulfonate monooxygenase